MTSKLLLTGIFLSFLLYFLPLIAASSSDDDRRGSASWHRARLEEARERRRRRQSNSERSSVSSSTRHDQRQGVQKPRVEYIDREVLAGLEAQNSASIVEDCLQNMLETDEMIPDLSKLNIKQCSHVHSDPTSNWELAKTMLAKAAYKALEMNVGTAPTLSEDLGKKLAAADSETRKGRLVEKYARKMLDRVRQGRFLFAEKHEEMAAALQRQEGYDAEQQELEQKGEHQFLTVEF